jgi:hypothetical protein
MLAGAGVVTALLAVRAPQSGDLDAVVVELLDRLVVVEVDPGIEVVQVVDRRRPFEPMFELCPVIRVYVVIEEALKPLGMIHPTLLRCGGVLVARSLPRFEDGPDVSSRLAAKGAPVAEQSTGTPSST